MPAQTKRQMAGTILKTDWEVEDTFISVGCMINLQGVGVEYETSESLICITDTGPPETAPGDEMVDVVSGQLLQDPFSIDDGETGGVGAGADEQMWKQIMAGTERTWQIVYVDAAGALNDKIAQFEGWVRKLKPISCAKKDWLLYDLEIVRTTDVAWSGGDVPTTTTAPP